MSTDTESFNKDLYNLLKVRGYKPVPLDSKNQRVPASQAADVIQFTFNKDGESYGKAWVTIDETHTVTVYYDEEQQKSPSTSTPGLEYDDSWTGFLKHLKQWAQRRQLSFDLYNKDRLDDDMSQREYYRMKEKLGESYHPMGKKASYNDAVPNVKIVLQHNRNLEEGEARYRNIAKIYLENVDGERFLAPTTKPGMARIYARHIAEGGVPNDERWNHIKAVCEDYNKMSAFVRATKNKQFNESAQSLINEGIAHYNSLRETLQRLSSHRGYNTYFESWTPTLMETDMDESINDLFVQEMVDPRIENAMPILSRLNKNVSLAEVDELSSWAEDVINEKLELNELSTDTVERYQTYADKEAMQAYRNSKFKAAVGSTDAPKLKRKLKQRSKGLDMAAKKLGGQAKIPSTDISEVKDKQGDDYKKWRKKNFNDKKTTDDIVNGSDTRTKYGIDEGITDTLRKGVKNLKRGFNGWEKGMHDVDTVKRNTATLDKPMKDAIAKKKVTGVFGGMDTIPRGSPAELQQKLIKREKNKQVDEGAGAPTFKRIDDYSDWHDDYVMRMGAEYDETDLEGQLLGIAQTSAGVRGIWYNKQKFGTISSTPFEDEVEYIETDPNSPWLNEGLDANQKRVGQLGPTEKVKNNNIGKLVGASESKEIPEELTRIIEMARFKR